MGFLIYDISFLIIFCLFLGIFFIRHRKKFHWEGIICLYRTAIGLKAINYIAKKYKKLLDYFEYVLVVCSYIFMAASLYLIFQVVYLFIKIPNFSDVIKIPPIMPLIPYLPEIFKADYLPSFNFTTWIIVIAITAIGHEFFHGIFFKKDKIKIKSTGFGFLGPFLAFFVEPDEEKVKKLAFKKQNAAMTAGSFANILMFLLFSLLLLLYFNLAYIQAGAVFSGYSFAVIKTSEITHIGNESIFIEIDGGLNLTEIKTENKKYFAATEKISKIKESEKIVVLEDAPALRAGIAGVIIEFDGEKISNSEELSRILGNTKPNQIVQIKTRFNNSIKEYEIALGERPDNENKEYLGITSYNLASKSFFGKIKNKIIFYKNPNTDYKARMFSDLTEFIYNIFVWLIIVNLGVALTNMLPLGIFDGGRVFYITMLAIFKNEKIAKNIYKFATYLIIAVFLYITLLYFFG